MALAAAVIAVWFVTDQLGEFGGDPSGFARFSVYSSGYAEPLIGEVLISEGAGHDGKFFFALANDPWLVNPDVNAIWLDAPVYRAQRIAYPMLAGGFGLFPPSVVIWTLLVVNVVSLIGGSVAVAAVAMELGRTRWLGLAFVLNPGMLFETLIDGSSVVAMALAFAGVFAFQRRSYLVSGGLLAVAVLSRETTVLIVIGLVLWRVLSERRLPIRFLAVAIAPYAIWIGWASWRLREVEVQFSASGLNLDAPFKGLWEVLPNWLGAWNVSAAFGVLILLACLVIIGSAVSRRDLLSVSMLGYALLPAVLSSAVLAAFFDVTRVIAPVFTSALVILAPERVDRVLAQSSPEETS